ncbi:MAG: TonB-dependent receptor [Rhodoferax sp.]|nr:TonB-dependent receptor [Rhodoferax sp.]
MLTKISQAICLMAAASGAYAQSASTGKELNTVVVTGVRASLESALNAKRNDNGIVDVIKAEDMGKFPDTNLAESLQRIPGVVIDRDAGEGRAITVRGLGQDFTRVRINGIEALATTGGTDSSGGANRGRGFDFNVFASELFNTVTVRKSSSADVEEGSLGATVDLQSTRPFDLKKGSTAMVSAKGSFNEMSKTTTPRAAFLFANSNDDKTFGVLVSGAFSKRKLNEEGFSSVRWDNGPSSGGWCAPTGVTANPSNSTATTCGPAAQGVPRLTGTPENIAAYNAASSASNFHPRLPRYGRLTHDQDRVGLTAAVQLKPADSTLLTFDLMYSKLNATRQEDFLEAISFSRSAAQGGKPQTSVVSASYDANGALQNAVFNGVDVRAESRFDELSTTFVQPTLTLEHAFSDSLKLTAKIGSAKSVFDNPVQTTTTLDALNVNGYGLDFRSSDRLPLITYPFSVTDPNGALKLVGVPQVTSGTQPGTVPNTTTSEIRIRPQGATNRNDLANFNLAWDAAEGLNIKGGIDYKRYTFDTFEFRRVNQNDTIFAPPAGTSAASLTTTLTGFGNGLSLPAGTPTSWVIPNLNAIASAYDIYCNCLKSGPAGGPGDFTLSSTTNGNARGNNRAVVETDTGGYLMADFDSAWGGVPVRGNFGVRYVQTKQVATGYQATAGGTEVTVTNTYNDVLPSVNLSASLSKDFIVRVAAANVMSRPQLGNLNPGGTISTTGTLSITTGNPFLQPFRARTLDTSFEWYHSKNAFIGLGLFTKDISTYIQSLRTNIPYKETGLPMSLLPTNFTGDEVFQVTTPINTNGGKLKGVELNFQQPFTFLPGFGKNFGALLNYTLVESKIDYQVSPTSTVVITDDLLNLSPRAWNATLYYDDGVWSGRLSASSRSDFLTRVPGQNNNDVEGKAGSLNLDMSMSYKVNQNLEVTLEAVNLLNTPNDQFISRARNSSVVYHVTGREFLIGARYKF